MDHEYSADNPSQWLTFLEAIDPVCVAFEATCRDTGEPPSMEAYLEGYEGSQRQCLLRELLLLELEHRRRRGESPTREEYCQRFPDDSTFIKRLFQRRGETLAVSSDSSVMSVAEPPPPPLVQDKQFGDYELLEELGKGGMGVVYRARQKGADRDVALKLVRPERLAALREERKAELTARFYEEIKAAAKLDHDHIVRVYDVGQLYDQPYFAMQFIAGQGLDEMLEEGPLSGRDAATLLEPVCRAVASAHRSGIVHRDLKPGNIMVDKTGKPYVTDFGLAKLHDADQQLTQTGQVLGTPPYMSPEQTQGETISPASDTYSLGATLYEMLTGRPPFRAATVGETMRQVIFNEPVPPSRLNPDVERDIESICLKCLEKQPQQRYSTADQLAEDLSRFLRGENVEANPITAPVRAIRWCRRNPLVASLSGVSLSLLAIAVLLAFVGWYVKSAESRTQGELLNRLGFTEGRYEEAVTDVLDMKRSIRDQRATITQLNNDLAEERKTNNELTASLGTMRTDLERLESTVVRLQSELDHRADAEAPSTGIDSQHVRFSTHLREAQHFLDEDDQEQARAALLKAWPDPANVELGNFAWYHLWRRANRQTSFEFDAPVHYCYGYRSLSLRSYRQFDRKEKLPAFASAELRRMQLINEDAEKAVNARVIRTAAFNGPRPLFADSGFDLRSIAKLRGLHLQGAYSDGTEIHAIFDRLDEDGRTELQTISREWDAVQQVVIAADNFPYLLLKGRRVVRWSYEEANDDRIRQQVDVVSGLGGDVTSIHSQGSYLTTGHANGAVQVWKMPESSFAFNATPAVFGNLGDSVESVATFMLKDSAFVAAAPDRGKIHVFDGKTKRLLTKLGEDSKSYRWLAVPRVPATLPLIGAVTENSQIHIWNGATGKLVCVVPRRTRNLLDYCFDDNVVYASYTDCSVRFQSLYAGERKLEFGFDVADLGKPLQPPPDHRQIHAGSLAAMSTEIRLNHIALQRGDEHLMIGRSDAAWPSPDRTSGLREWKLEARDASAAVPTTMAFSHNGKILARAVYQTGSGTTIEFHSPSGFGLAVPWAKTEVNGKLVVDLHFDAEGKYLYGVGYYGELFAFEISNKDPPKIVEPPAYIAKRLKSDGQTMKFSLAKGGLAALHEDGSVRIWATETLKKGPVPGDFDCIVRPTGKITALALSPEGDTLAIGLKHKPDEESPTTGVVEIWDVHAALSIYTMAMSHLPRKIVLSEQSRSMLVATDERVRLYRGAVTGDELTALFGDRDAAAGRADEFHRLLGPECYRHWRDAEAAISAQEWDTAEKAVSAFLEYRPFIRESDADSLNRRFIDAMVEAEVEIPDEYKRRHAAPAGNSWERAFNLRPAPQDEDDD